jgi:predicted dehydrogenase
VLWGPVARVYAEVDRRRPGVQVDDDAFVALEHASGVRSHLWMSAAAPEHDLRFRVLGSRAAYVKHGLDVQEAALRAGVGPGPGWGEEPEALWGRVGVPDAWTPVPTEPGAWPAYYAGIAAALRDGAPPPVDPADAVEGLRIIEAARRSAAERTIIELA